MENCFKNDCSLERACKYCKREIGKNGCTNEMPHQCESVNKEYKNSNSGGEQNSKKEKDVEEIINDDSKPAKRIKREMAPVKGNISYVDFDSNAVLVNLLMSLEDFEVRKELGHSFGNDYSSIENSDRPGFIYSCLFKGVENCSNKRF